MKKKYSKEELVAARVEYRAALKVMRSLRKILHPRIRRKRWVDIIPRFERRMARLEERVKKLSAKKAKR